MINPILQDTDTIRRGATYLRGYFTGTLDTTGMTPSPSLLKRRDGSIAGTVQMARLALNDGSPDNFNFALVISRAVTSTLDPSAQYLLNVDFDTDDGSTIPHGVISLTVLPGESRQ